MSAHAGFSRQELSRRRILRHHNGVKGKQIHDANVVATMLANDVTRLATFNRADFQRFEDEITLEVLVA
jgi:predicted nucleic acid-binding protein